MSPEKGEVTRLLDQWCAGSPEAESHLFALVLPDLKRLARHMMKGERPGHTLQSSDLVNEIYLRLVRAKNHDWRNRQHFFAITARAMRRYLIDYARGRPDVGMVPLDDLQRSLRAKISKRDLTITVDRLLEELEKIRPEWCTVVELKYFLGLTDEEAAEALGLKLRTMQRMWMDARRWLFERLDPGNARGAQAG